MVVGAGLMALPGVAVAQIPSIAEAFGATSVPLSGTTTLTFTITDSDPPSSPHAVSFDDTLPAGLQVAGTPTTTCTAGVLAPSATSDIVFTDPLLIDPSCTVSATVQGVQAGHRDNPVMETVDLGSASTDASLDVVAPPSISAAFGTTLLGRDGTTPLTFTITNPNPSFGLTGLSFTDALPAGMVIAGQPAAGDTCGGDPTAVAGTDSLGLAGGQLAPGATCTVSATIAATATGTFTDTTTQVLSTEGGIGNTAAAVLTVIGAPVTTLSSPLGGHVYAFGEQVPADFGCVDDPSGPGIRSCVGTAPDGSPIDTDKAGAHSFTVTATSLDDVWPPKPCSTRSRPTTASRSPRAASTAMARSASWSRCRERAVSPCSRRPPAHAPVSDVLPRPCATPARCI